MSKNNLIYIVIGVGLTFTFLYLVYNLINRNYLAVLQEITKIKTTDHLKWSADKKNLLIEYSDFQCPACRSFHEYIRKEIESSSTSAGITKKVTFIFRHFPLYQIHPNAFEPAYAAEAAGRQGKFFEMVNLLFSQQDQWSKSQNLKDSFTKMAQSLGLDEKRFGEDFDSKAVKDKVDADLSSGEKADINSTPTFFLNGQKLELTSVDQLKTLLISL